MFVRRWAGGWVDRSIVLYIFRLTTWGLKIWGVHWGTDWVIAILLDNFSNGQALRGTVASFFIT